MKKTIYTKHYKNEEEIIIKHSIAFIKANKKLLIEKFANDNICEVAKKNEKVVTFFMAGSPGAGKTEFSKIFLKELNTNAVRIDADEIRNIIPNYNGKNSHLVQSATSIGVEKLYDYVLAKKKNVIVDGTFAIDFDKAKSNIQRSLSKNRNVFIFYIYQEPQLAWKFTQAREELEGRRITKERFIESFLIAQKNVQLVKKEFQDKITLSIIIKNIENGFKKYYIDVENIDSYIKNSYNKKTLDNLIQF